MDPAFALSGELARGGGGSSLASLGRYVGVLRIERRKGVCSATWVLEISLDMMLMLMLMLSVSYLQNRELLTGLTNCLRQPKSFVRVHLRRIHDLVEASCEFSKYPPVAHDVTGAFPLHRDFYGVLLFESKIKLPQANSDQPVFLLRNHAVGS